MRSPWTPLHARVHGDLRQRQLLASGQRVLVAVSGGQDSLCVLQLLCDLRPQWQWTLAIAHCDHGWSGDAGIAERVAQVAETLQLPLLLRRDCVPETEAAARTWRYQMLAEMALADGFAAVVTGHTESDRAETLLANLMRGAGTDGLQALSWRRELTAGVDVVRPLLGVTRAETGAFCADRNLPVWEDAANRDRRFARNRIRHDLLPGLRAFNPRVETALAQTAEVLRAEVEYLDARAREVARVESKAIARPPLQTAHLALQRRAVRQFLQRHLARDPSFAQIEAVVALIAAPQKTRSTALPGRDGSVVAEVCGDWIRLLPARAASHLRPGAPRSHS